MIYVTFNENISNRSIIAKKFNIDLEGYYIPLNEKLSKLLESFIEVSMGKGIIIDVTGLDVGRMAYIGAVYTVLESLDYNVQVVALRNEIMMDITHHYALNSLVHTICDCMDLDKNRLVSALRKFENLP